MCISTRSFNYNINKKDYSFLGDIVSIIDKKDISGLVVTNTIKASKAFSRGTNLAFNLKSLSARPFCPLPTYLLLKVRWKSGMWSVADQNIG